MKKGTKDGMKKRSHVLSRVKGRICPMLGGAFLLEEPYMLVNHFARLISVSLPTKFSVFFARYRFIIKIYQLFDGAM